MEVLGCGMVNPKVFDSVSYDSAEFTGLAFGMGIERLAMIKLGITDLCPPLATITGSKTILILKLWRTNKWESNLITGLRRWQLKTR